MSSEEKFQAAVNIIKSLPKDGPYQPSNEMMLKFYALYKQATLGQCSDPKPAFYEVVKGYKWRAWNALGDMQKTDAMATYVEELTKIIETMSYTEDVANFIDVLGPFYEYVEVPGKKSTNNNNNKGSDDSGDEKEAQMTNGHTVNGNGVSDSESGDSSIELDQNSSTESSPQHLATQNLHEVCEDSEEVLMVLETTMSCAEGEESLQAELHRAEQELEPQLAEENDIKNSNSPELENHILQQEPVLCNGQDPGHTVGLSSQVLVNSISSNDSGALGSSAPLSAVQRLLSDTESDEEYSEPAESIVSASHLATPSVPIPAPVSVTEAITHGGGDKSHPGGLQMTPKQTTQSRTFQSGPPRSSVDNTFSDGSSATGYGNTFSGGSGGGWGGPGDSGGGRRSSGDVNAQLVLVLRRLQTDMENVLHRLNTLETLTLTHHHSVCLQSQQQGSTSSVSGSITQASSPMEKSWWPFPELSPRSTFFLLVWPIILHGGIKLLLLLRSRRRRS